jgi:hypothetical protein
MQNKLMMGLWRYIINVPSFLWEMQIAMAAKKFEKEHSFMTEPHREVHHFVVRELPRIGRPMPPDFIAKNLDMSEGRVNAILDDLETHMTFLFRNKYREVIWAYPVTVEKTPHHVSFHSGETLYAA